jgi:hypothetical protein
MGPTESLFLINPRRRKRRKGRMPAGLARYWASRRGGGRKRRKARMVASNPRRRRRRNPVVRSYRRRARRSNPVRHYRRRARRSNPIRARRRHRRSNPFSTRSLTAFVKPAAIGAAGAIAMSIAYGYLAPSLPASITGMSFAPALLQLAGAVGIGMLVGKFMSKQDGQYATIGAATVVIAGQLTPLLASAAPSLPGLSGLRGISDYVPYSRPGMGAYMKRPGMGRLGQVGFYSPAAVIQNQPGQRAMGAYLRAPVPGMADLSGGSGFNGMNDGM